MANKVCKKCQIIKPHEEFDRDKKTPDGLYYICKPCSRAYYKEWELNNPDKKKQYSQKQYQKNREKIIENTLKRYRANPDEWNLRTREWDKRHPEKARARGAKHSNKRQRGLGYKLLNKWFKGAEGHHIGRELVIYMPKELHQAVYHSLIKGTGMKEINAVALDYLFTSATV